MTCVTTRAITTIAGTPSNQRRIGIVASSKSIRLDRTRQDKPTTARLFRHLKEGLKLGEPASAKFGT